MDCNLELTHLMEKNPGVLFDTYYSNLKQASSSFQLKTAEQNQTLRRTCLGLCSPPRLPPQLKEEYATAIRISKLSLTNEDEESFTILKNIYKFLTSTQEEPNKKGNHWENIGFQGENPATDLRAAGLMSIVHLLFFFEHNPTYFRDVYLLGTSEKGNFPFTVVGINLSKIVLDCMREGVLNKEFNKRQDVTVVMNLFYQGLWHFLAEYVRKLKGPHNIMEFHRTLATVESFARDSPSKVLENYEKFMNGATGQQKSNFQSEIKATPKPNQASVEVSLTDITLDSNSKATQ